MMVRVYDWLFRNQRFCHIIKEEHKSSILCVFRTDKCFEIPVAALKKRSIWFFLIDICGG